MKRIKLFEQFVNEEFYLEGFKQNMKSKVEGNIDQYIDFDEEANRYYVKIPYDKIKGGVDEAGKIIHMYSEGRYPKCKVAKLDADKQEVLLVFTNESKTNENEDPIEELVSQFLYHSHDSLNVPGAKGARKTKFISFKEFLEGYTNEDMIKDLREYYLEGEEKKWTDEQLNAAIDKVREENK